LLVPQPPSRTSSSLVPPSIAGITIRPSVTTAFVFRVGKLKRNSSSTVFEYPGEHFERLS